MTHRESWYREATLFEGELRTLMEEARRGLIEPEEFMKRMLRFHHGEERIQERVYFLEDGGSSDYPLLKITRAWLLAHRVLVSKILEEIGNPWMDGLLGRTQEAFRLGKPTHGYTSQDVSAVFSNMGQLERDFSKPGNIAVIHESLGGHYLYAETEGEFNEFARKLPQMIRDFRELWQ